MKARRGISKRRAFLAAFRLTASLTKAAEAAKVERGMHYRWLKEDQQYAADFAAAREEAAQALEDEAVRRANEGTLKPVFYKGKPAGVVREYSDALLMFLLKGFRPERFRDRGSVEVSGPNGGPIPLTDNRLASLTDDQLSSLIAITRQLASAEGSRGGTAAPEAE